MADYGFTVEFRGFREFLAKLGASPEVINDAKDRMLNELAGAALSRAKQEAPVRTGILRGSITMRVEEEEARVGTNLNYARYQEYGTRPHVIQAINKKVLADKKRGLIFGKRVMHPGFPGKYYMKKGLQEAKDRVNSIFSKVANEIKSQLSFTS